MGNIISGLSKQAPLPDNHTNKSPTSSSCIIGYNCSAKEINALPQEKLAQIDARTLNMQSYLVVRNLEDRVLNNLSDQTLADLRGILVYTQSDGAIGRLISAGEKHSKLEARVLNGLSNVALKDIGGEILNWLSIEEIRKLDSRVLNHMSDKSVVLIKEFVFENLSEETKAALDPKLFSKQLQARIVTVQPSPTK